MTELLKELTECKLILESVSETFWSKKIGLVLEKIHGNNTRVVEPGIISEILSWYGGMGSFNDLTLSHLNGHSFKPSEELFKNSQLHQRREAIYHLVRKLRM